MNNSVTFVMGFFFVPEAPKSQNGFICTTYMKYYCSVVQASGKGWENIEVTVQTEAPPGEKHGNGALQLQASCMT